MNRLLALTKGKRKIDGPMNDLSRNNDDQHRYYDDKEIEYARFKNDVKELATRPRV